MNHAEHRPFQSEPSETSPDGVSQDKIQLLAKHYPEFINGCDSECLGLMSKADNVEFPGNMVMFRERDPCENFIWLTSGSVRVYKHSPDGREVTLYRVEPGDLCVLSLNSLLGNRPYPAEAKTEGSISGIMLNSKKFMYGVHHSDTFRTYVLRIMTDRINDMMTLVSEIAFQRLDLRLACMLGQRFERTGGESLQITHAELARELGTTREVVSRILKEFEHQQCIRLSRGNIHLVSQQGLDWFGSAAENQESLLKP